MVLMLVCTQTYSTMSLAACVAHLQLSHHLVAQGRADEARKRCLQACRVASEVLGHSDSARHIAKYALDFHTRVLADGAAALLFAQKLCWLGSTVRGIACYPIWAGLDCEGIPPVEIVEPQYEFPDLPYPVDVRAVDVQDTGDHLADLYQDLLPNCSFVLSLLSIAEGGMASQLRQQVHIFGDTAKVTLRFNGCVRTVAVSTKLPHVKANRSIVVSSSSDPHMVWPALLEKAFLVAMGQHYNFSGSNMAQDTYMLVGWLPEVRKVSSCGLAEMARLWELKQQGSVLLGLGTGPLSPQLASQLGVIPEHDYVLSDYDPENHVLTLKNPWLTREAALDDKKRYLTVDLSLLGLFSYVYINWKPQHKHCAQTNLICGSTNGPASLLVGVPQYSVVNSLAVEQKVSVLVEQYITAKDAPPVASPFCVAIYKGSRRALATTVLHVCVAGGTFSNERMQLLELTLEPSESYIVAVMSERDETPKSRVYNLSIFHDMADFDIERAKRGGDHILPTESGSWGLGYNGGNWATECYIDNPQYDLEVPAGTANLELLLATEEQSQANVNIHLFHSEDSEKHKKVRNFDKSKLLFCDDYISLVFSKSLPEVEPGLYKLVVSAYEREVTENFNLMLSNDGPAPVVLTKIPQALGTFLESTSFEWGGQNRHKIICKAQHSSARVTFHLQAGEKGSQNISNYRPAVRASVFDAFNKEPVVVNSKWNESVYGVFIECTLPRGDCDYILLIERFERGEGKCRVTVGSSCRVSLN